MPECTSKGSPDKERGILSVKPEAKEIYNNVKGDVYIFQRILLNCLTPAGLICSICNPYNIQLVILVYELFSYLSINFLRHLVSIGVDLFPSSFRRKPESSEIFGR